VSADARLCEWLAVTEEALRAPPQERLSALRHAHERRETLRAELEAEPPAAPPDAETVARLRAAETDLERLATELGSRLRETLEEARRRRAAAARYRPARASSLFVSRSI
jgi:hypothetical protein